MSKKSRIELPSDEDVRKFGGAPTEPEPAEPTAEPEAAAPAAPAAPPRDAAALERELEECRDKLLRAKAENQNLVRRTAVEKSEAIRYANEVLMKALLPVVDGFERTLAAARESENSKALVEGVSLVYEQMLKVLRDNGVTPIEALGKAFDPVHHSAAMQQPSPDHEPGTVLHELQKGYRLCERVIRPAHVVIAGKPAAETSPVTDADAGGCASGE